MAGKHGRDKKKCETYKMKGIKINNKKKRTEKRLEKLTKLRSKRNGLTVKGKTPKDTDIKAVL